MRKINLIGKKFGRLLVISELKEKDNNDIIYNCLCDCGKYKDVPSRHLRDEKTKSCGCLAQEIRSKNGKLHKIKDRESVLYKGLFAKFRNDVKHRNHKNYLSLEEFIYLSKGNCFYCGSHLTNKFIYTYSGEEIKYNGIDRLDNKEEYTIPLYFISSPEYV